MLARQGLFFLLLVLGTISCAALWIAPVNEYEWMWTDPVIGGHGAPLPVDEDSPAIIALLSVPAILSAVAVLAVARWGLRGRLRVVAAAFGLGLMAIVAVKLLL